LKNPEEIEEDFQRLTVFKCPLKVLVFSVRDSAGMKTRAEEYTLYPAELRAHRPVLQRDQ